MKTLAAMLALVALAAFAAPASADCPAHAAQKENPDKPVGT